MKTLPLEARLPDIRTSLFAQIRSVRKKESRHVTGRRMDIRIGLIPLPVYGLMLTCLFALIAAGPLPHDISVMIALLAIGGFSCAELGARLPGLKSIGGPVIVTTLLPAYLVYIHWLPLNLTQAVGDFWHSTNVVYLFIASVTVGAVLSMERTVLINGFARLALPLASASIAAAIMGLLTGWALGLSAAHTFFHLIIPIMAGGVGEGAIPLTLGYSEILHTPQGPLLAHVMPAVVLGNLTAVICVSVLKQIGIRHPYLSGQGQLMRAGHPTRLNGSAPSVSSIEQIAAAGMVAIGLYLFGLLVHRFTGLPAPVGMLGLAVLARIAGLVSPKLEDGARTVHAFCSKALTYPLLFAMGLTLMQWQGLIDALTFANLITIVVIVLTLTTVGFFVSRRAGLYPVEGAIVTACHSGMGGIGDVAILTAADRLPLMPFAQIATRIGGAITLTAALVLLAQVR